MISAHDVAAYILERHGPIAAVKLHTLMYYAQAWSMAWDGRPLFPERIEAWTNGPVVPVLHDGHRGQFQLRVWRWGEPERLDDAARAAVDAVLDRYGPRTAQSLTDQIHSESPWKDARRGLSDVERGTREISRERMMEYYASLPPDGPEAAHAGPGTDEVVPDGVEMPPAGVERPSRAA